MLPVANNILDQLLGGFDTQQVGAVGQGEAAGAIGAAAEAGIEALDFNQLLMQLGAGLNSVKVVDTDPQTQLSVMPDLLGNGINLLEMPVGPEKPEGAALTLSAKSPLPVIDLPSDELAITIDQSRGVVRPLVDGVEIITDDAIVTAETETARPLMAEFLSSRSLRAQVQMSQEVALKPGLYQIVDSEVKSDRLEMTLLPPTDDAEPIKVSLPADLLNLAEKTLVSDKMQGRQTVNHTVGRVPLANPGQPQVAQLGDLFSKLNLKTLEVSVEQKTEQPATAEQLLKLTLVAEQSGQEVALKTKLKAGDLRARSEVKNNATLIKVTGDASQPQPKIEGEPHAQANDQIETNEKTVAPKSAARINTPFDLANKFEVPTQAAKAEPGQFSINATGDNNIGHVNRSATEFTTPQVKLSLPENIDKPFSAGGQTIMLKIEPDHLGPARLTLAIRHQMLTARVIVDTPMARMAIENSLDQLTEQLSRAGLDVDRIEVLLSGDNAHEQFFDRRSAWSHARKLRQDDANFEIDGHGSEESSAILAAPHEYIGPAGIDVRA